MADQIEKPADNSDVEKDESSQDDLDYNPDRHSQEDDVNCSSDKDSENITLDALFREELQYIEEISKPRPKQCPHVIITSHNRPGLPIFQRATLKNTGRPGYEAISIHQLAENFTTTNHTSLLSHRGHTVRWI